MARKKRKYTRRVPAVAAASAVSAFEAQEGGDHYKSMNLQPMFYILMNDLGAIEGRVTEYMARWRKKGGIGDLKKARHLLDLAIEFYSSQTKA
jgi:hypothetical protein